MMQIIIDNIHFIDYDVIDDVAIGMLINSKFPDIIPYHINNRVFVHNCNGNYKELDNIMNYMIIQNKNNDRMIDVNQMKYITAEGNEKYNYLIDIMYYNMCQNYSNIHEHLPTLKKYADECNSIIQLGYDQGNAIWAFIRAIRNNNKLLLVDNNPKDILNILDITNKLNLNFSYKWSNYLDLEVDETFDLTFIDTWHVYGQLKRELDKFSKITNKYIIMHDTTTFGTIDEPIYQPSCKLLNINSEKQGLVFALEEFMTSEEGKNWTIKEVFTNNNGLTIIERKKCQIALN
jgi:ribosomal protein RSM22 (predicted rRNA methylase)